jgi:hypothetical protein
MGKKKVEDILSKTLTPEEFKQWKFDQEKYAGIHDYFLSKQVANPERSLQEIFDDSNDELGPKVYIASAYTKGDQAMNTKFQIDIFNILLDLGFCPIVPLVSHFLHLVHPRPYEDWIKYDNALLPLYDCCLKFEHIPSSGADGEEEQFLQMGKRVFKDIFDLCEYYGHAPTSTDILNIHSVKIPTIDGSFIQPHTSWEDVDTIFKRFHGKSFEFAKKETID